MKLTKLAGLLISCSMMVAVLPGSTFAGTDHNSNTAAAKHEATQDGEILAFLMAVDNHEIKAADEVGSNHVDSSVTEYADMLKKDHEKNLADVKEVSKSINVEPVTTNAVKQFEAKGDKEIKHLSTLKDAKFQAAFLQAMVNGHSEVLTKIDMYLGKVKNDSVKQLLKDTRSAVKSHLDEAKKLQKSVK